MKWEAVHEILRGNERYERRSKIHLLDGAPVEVFRPPVGADGTIELRLSGTSPDAVLKVKDTLIELFRTRRERPSTGGDRRREQQARVGEKLVARWQADIVPPVQEGDEELTVISDDEGYAKVRLSRSRA